MAKRTFNLSYDYWQAELEIDEELAGQDIKESVEFWMDWRLHLSKCKNDYTLAFVKNVAPILIAASMEHGIEYVTEDYFKQEEGYGMPFDGSTGILLKRCTEWEFDADFMDINETTPGNIKYGI